MVLVIKLGEVVVNKLNNKLEVELVLEMTVVPIKL